MCITRTYNALKYLKVGCKIPTPGMSSVQSPKSAFISIKSWVLKDIDRRENESRVMSIIWKYLVATA